MKKKFDLYIKNHDLKNCENLYLGLDEREQLSKDMIAFSIILKIARMEEDNGIKGLFWRNDCNCVDDLVKLYYSIKYYLRRIEYDIEISNAIDFVSMNISIYMLIMMISLFSSNKQKVATYMEKHFKNRGDKEMEHVLHEYLCKGSFVMEG